MKKIFASLILATSLSQNSLAAETNAQQPNPDSNKMTTKDAKKSCKEEGKTGADLIKCMKEKKQEK